MEIILLVFKKIGVRDVLFFMLRFNLLCQPLKLKFLSKERLKKKITFQNYPQITYYTFYQPAGEFAEKITTFLPKSSMYDCLSYGRSNQNYRLSSKQCLDISFWERQSEPDDPLMKGRIVCRLYIGEEIIKEQKTKQQREKAS